MATFTAEYSGLILLDLKKRLTPSHMKFHKKKIRSLWNPWLCAHIDKILS